MTRLAHTVYLSQACFHKLGPQVFAPLGSLFTTLDVSNYNLRCNGEAPIHDSMARSLTLP